MQITSILTTSLLLLPAVLGAPAPGTSPAEGHQLEALACSYTTGCRSKVDITPGKYCGYCPQVSGVGTSFTSIFQLSGTSGASGCCKYGSSSKCADLWETGSSKEHAWIQLSKIIANNESPIKRDATAADHEFRRLKGPKGGCQMPAMNFAIIRMMVF